MEQTSINLVKEFLTAVQSGNTEKLGALLHPHIQWSQPGSNQVSGIKKSAADVFQMVGKMYELSASTLRLTDIQALAANGNQVACLVHWQATNPAGNVLDIDNIDVYTVENGQIVQATVFSADVDAENDFWGKVQPVPATHPVSSADTKRIVQEFYSALASRDLDAVAGKFADEIDWYIPGEESLAPWVGRRSKKEEVKAFFELLLQNIESVYFELEHILAEDNVAVATGYFISKMLASGKNYESPFSAHFTIKNNRIVRYRFLEDSNGLVKSLGTLATANKD